MEAEKQKISRQKFTRSNRAKSADIIADCANNSMSIDEIMIKHGKSRKQILRYMKMVAPLKTRGRPRKEEREIKPEESKKDIKQEDLSIMEKKAESPPQENDKQAAEVAIIELPKNDLVEKKLADPTPDDLNDYCATCHKEGQKIIVIRGQHERCPRCGGVLSW